jgi:hypothetical protein
MSWFQFEGKDMTMTVDVGEITSYMVGKYDEVEDTYKLALTIKNREHLLMWESPTPQLEVFEELWKDIHG